MTACPFCNPSPERILLQNELCLALYDGYPVIHSLEASHRYSGGTDNLVLVRELEKENNRCYGKDDHTT